MAAARDGHPELGEDVAHVPVHRPLAQDQLGGDGPVGPAGGDQAQDLDLPRGQPTRRPGPAPPGQRLQPGQVGGGAEPLEGPAGGVQLHRRRVLVAEGAAGQPDQHPGPGRLVRRLQLPPRRPGAAQRGQGGHGVALGQQDGALGVGGRGPQQRRVQLGGGGVQLLGRRPGGRQVAAGQGDLHSGRQQPAPGPAGRWPRQGPGGSPPAAAAACPWASRSRARPGWGSRPHRLARR